MDNKRKVVIFVTTSFGTGTTGPEIYARYLWDAFWDETSFEFHLVAPSIVEKHPRLHSVVPAGGSLQLYREVAQKAMELATRLKSVAHVLIHVNTSNLHQCLLSSPCPVWGQINDYENTLVYRNAITILKKYGMRRFFALWRRRFLERRFISFQATTLCNSHYTRSRILECYSPAHPDRLIVLHKAVDVVSFRKPAQLPPDPLDGDHLGYRVLYVGSDFIRKGLDVLVEAICLLGKGYHLTVVGVTREQFATVFPAIAKHLDRSGAVVEFMGKVSREGVKSLLWHSQLFCLPSRDEALGVAILEALAASLPCVSTQVGGIPEILGGSPCGRMVPELSAEHLSKAILAASQESAPPDQEFEFALAKFSKEVMVGKLRHLYLTHFKNES